MTNNRRPGTKAVSAQGITFSYGSRQILHDVSLSVNYGEVVGLLGPNGTGKSTLVGIMAGDLEADQGSVRYEESELAQFSRRELAQTRSVMPQAIDFPFSYMVQDIVAMGRQCWDPDPQRDQEIVSSSLERTDVGGFEDRDVTRLSGGEKARVTLSRVLAQEASVVFLDEPTAALDIAHQERTMQICRELAQAGHAVIAVMHDLQLAGTHCDRIALMSHGSIAAYDRPEVVLNSELLSQVYDWPIDVIRVAGRLVVLPQSPA
ncbi:heme ABC transporter ATP-binding protein [Arcanobacterium pinnipediorum]|uniref:Heme ABC transporter ATP-binding protein n=1 Tax=Arcanobacterium pinnipediorum TaxID=1503041 RepID=A0ABY5AHL9_9ACTO|nr:heme ABC transporter ATP-binding protein [Arcanobacterium pinnipediorum]USR79697.1 heme ABC transporter ATP-binding protein [Arcanobacterium pinnipediorum]